MHGEARGRGCSWWGMVLAVLWLLISDAAHAQVDAGGLLRDIQGTPGLPKLDDAETGSELPLPKREISDVPELRLDVAGFEIAGVSDDEAAALRAKLASFTGKDRSFQDLLDAAGVVKNHFNAQGYLLAQAYIPEQKISDGIVRIVVLLGRLGKIDLNYNEQTPVSRARIQGYLDRLQAGSVLQTRGDKRHQPGRGPDLHVQLHDVRQPDRMARAQRNGRARHFRSGHRFVDRAWTYWPGDRPI